MQALRENLEPAARSASKVLITGESGVGKEVVAATIHGLRPRSRGPFVTLNCAGLPDSLLESELFGHERGSFTDAYRDKLGLLERAHGGTAFLDEIGDMSLRMQSVLLRFLESGEIQRVGGHTAGARVDVRIIAATNVPLPERVAAKAFREDLYYRLNVIHLVVPALRQRREDIPLLLRHFLAAYAERYRAAVVPEPSRDVLARLVGYDWPGNVRELKNLAERLVVRARTGMIELADLPAEIVQATDAPARGAGAQASAVAERLYHRMVTGGESFWDAVWGPFLAHDLTRDDLRLIVTQGLKQSRYSYRSLLPLFNMEPADYKRFLGALREFDCHVPLHELRPTRARMAEERREPDRRTTVR
jgi:DNA-binding NtrC family response regulator